MRNNAGHRARTRNNIDKFFCKALDALESPDFYSETKDDITQFEIPAGIHKSFVAGTYSGFYLNITYKDRPDTRHYVALPTEKYGSLSERWPSPPQLEKPAEELTQKTQQALATENNLKKGRAEFTRAANTALQETTLERVIARLPEIERFLKS